MVAIGLSRRPFIFFDSAESIILLSGAHFLEGITDEMSAEECLLIQELVLIGEVLRNSYRVPQVIAAVMDCSVVLFFCMIILTES